MKKTFYGQKDQNLEHREGKNMLQIWTNDRWTKVRPPEMRQKSVLILVWIINFIFLDNLSEAGIVSFSDQHRNDDPRNDDPGLSP